MIYEIEEVDREGVTAVGHHRYKTLQEGGNTGQKCGSECEWVWGEAFDEMKYFHGALLRYSHDPRAGVS